MIPKELLKALRKIEITTNRLATEQLSANYVSVFKGQGLAFSEVREYQPGDDVRTIDWNVSARMNNAYVKVFVEEREMTVMLVVDWPQQIFGTRVANKARSRQVGAVRVPRDQAPDRSFDLVHRSHREDSCRPRRGQNT